MLEHEIRLGRMANCTFIQGAEIALKLGKLNSIVSFTAWGNGMRAVVTGAAIHASMAAGGAVERLVRHVTCPMTA